MKKLVVVFLAVVICSEAYSQDQGIRFENGPSWKQLLKKAVKEKKKIMVDCYATWCGPCQMMEKKIFPLAEVGEKINKKFLSVRVQMDSTKNDDEAIKSWYPLARFFEKEYHVTAYPSFLFFNSKGEPLHKFIGATDNAKIFLSEVDEVDSANKRYFSLIDHYKEHLGDSSFLVNALSAAVRVEDRVNASAICDAYVEQRKGVLTKSDLQLIMANCSTTKSKGFQFILSHPAEVDTTFGADQAENFLIGTIRQELVYPLFSSGVSNVDWNVISDLLKAQYPLYAEDVLVKSKIVYYAQKEMKEEYGKCAVDYMNRYGFTMDAKNSNEFAWGVFINSNDSAALKTALGWSRRAISRIDTEPNASLYTDTYANLLYKLGRKEEAIVWEQKAISLGLKENRKTELKTYRETIARMKQGKKTWE